MKKLGIVWALIVALIVPFTSEVALANPDESYPVTGYAEINGSATCFMAPDNSSDVMLTIPAETWVDTTSASAPGWTQLYVNDGYCWVWFELVGSIPEQSQETTDTPTSDEAVQVIVTTEASIDEPQVVTALPDTGSGDGYGKVPEQSTAKTVLSIGAIVALCGIFAASVYVARRIEYGTPYYVDPEDVESLQR